MQGRGDQEWLPTETELQGLADGGVGEGLVWGREHGAAGSSKAYSRCDEC